MTSCSLQILQNIQQKELSTRSGENCENSGVSVLIPVPGSHFGEVKRQTKMWYGSSTTPVFVLCRRNFFSLSFQKGVNVFGTQGQQDLWWFPPFSEQYHLDWHNPTPPRMSATPRVLEQQVFAGWELDPKAPLRPPLSQRPDIDTNSKKVHCCLSCKSCCGCNVITAEISVTSEIRRNYLLVDCWPDTQSDCRKRLHQNQWLSEVSRLLHFQPFWSNQKTTVPMSTAHNGKELLNFTNFFFVNFLKKKKKKKNKKKTSASFLHSWTKLFPLLIQNRSQCVPQLKWHDNEQFFLAIKRSDYGNHLHEMCRCH